MPDPVTILPVEGIGEVTTGQDVAKLIVDALVASKFELQDDDVVVVTHKIVSKAEGRVEALPDASDSARHAIVEREAVRIVRRRGGLVIAETTHGFVCANAGVDNSNVEPGYVVLLPVDPDRSARGIRSKLKRYTERDVSVIISDTFGRAWRNGQTDVAIGVAGMEPIINYRGTRDDFGQELHVTAIAVADEIAGAAELVMGKSARTPVAIVRGADVVRGRGNMRSVIRPPEDDLFR